MNEEEILKKKFLLSMPEEKFIKKYEMRERREKRPSL